MRRLTVHLALLSLIGGAFPAHAVIPTHLWSQKYGSTSTDRVNGMAVDASGNVIITGSFIGSASFGGSTLVNAGGSDIFFAKYNSLGVHQWSFRFGGTGFDGGSAVAVDAAGNIFLSGNFEGSVSFGGGTLVSAGSDDAFLAKYNSSGVHQWSARYGSTSIDQGDDIAITSTGDGYLLGLFQGTVNFGGAALVSAGSYDIFLLKFSASGGHMISQRFGGTGFDRGERVVLDSSNNVVITGSFPATANFGGSNLISAGSDDIYLAKYEGVGNTHLWSKRFGSTSFDNGAAVAIDQADNLIATGSFNGTVNFGGSSLASAGGSDIYLARYNSAGTHLWSTRFGGASSDNSNAVALDFDDSILLTGSVSAPVDFGGGPQSGGGSFGLFVARFDNAASYRWSLVAGNSSATYGARIAVDPSGHVIAGGQLLGTMNLGGGDLAASGADAWVASFARNGLSPLIQSIADIGNDQGRRVKVRFVASGKDDPSAEPPVLQYEIYRRDDAPPAMTVDFATHSRARLFDDGWTFAGSVPAHEQNTYAADVSTIGDSTVVLGPYHSTFFVRAAGADPAMFFDSPPDSGYSLDNLAPGVPSSLVFETGDLSWNESTAADFDFFTVYGSNTNNFGAATVVDYSVAPAMDVSSSPYGFYFVTATDFAGNEGKHAVVNTLSGVGGSPKSYVLSVSNYPNPFNPRTTVSYTVPSRGRVTISIYDARGAHVATLFDGERAAGAYSVDWDGRTDDVAVAASGVYFARIEHASGTRSKKMVLLK